MSNSEDIVTRCPQCRTAFRVTLNQLAVADGQVRCGSCLAVFKALDHNAKEKNTPTNKQQTHSSTKTNTLTKSTATNSHAKVPTQQNAASGDNQDTLIADEEPNKLDLDGDIFDLDSESKNKKTSLFDRSLTTVKEHKRESADESWAIKMLAELEEEENQEKEQKTQFIIGSEPTESSNNFLNEESEAKVEPSPNKPTHDDEGLGFYDDNEPEGSGYDQIDLSADLETASVTTDHQNDDDPIYFNDTSPTENSDEYDLDSVLDGIQEEDKSASISDEDIENAMHSRTRYKDDPTNYLANIEPAPVEMSGLSSSSARRWLWRAGIVLLGVLLLIQTAILRFNTLSKHPSYRPYYDSACGIIGCQLPSLIDTQQIRTTNLIIRSHPSQENALIIDAILINNAPFIQPFPALDLEFNDINNQLIAKRQLQPNEYLRGELAGAKQMANNQPIQLSIEIVDPGDTAVNYQLTVSQAKTQK